MKLCPRPAGRQSCQIISLCFLLTFCREGTSAETPLTQAWMSQRNLMDGWICYTPIKLKLLPNRKSLFLVMNLLKPFFLFLCLIFKNWMLNLMLLTFVCVSEPQSSLTLTRISVGFTILILLTYFLCNFV